MEKPSTPHNIPAGRVAQRLKSLQDSSDLVLRTRSLSKTTSATTPQPVTAQEKQKGTPSNLSEEKHSETSTIDSRQYLNPVELSTAKASPQYDRIPPAARGKSTEPSGRGRPLQRSSDTESQDAEEIGDVLEDVRTRLYSVRKIVRRGRSGSSQARDEMLDDLGTMLDSAIATTMTPLNTPMFHARNPFAPIRTGSASPAKRSQSPMPPVRSQSVKNILPLHAHLTGRPPLSIEQTTHEARTEAPTRVQSPESSKKPSLIASELFARQRDRQVSEPVANFSRPFGYPLTSPVRERTLLWESMSRAAIDEENVVKCPHFVTRVYPVSPRASGTIKSPIRSPVMSPIKSRSTAPPMPLLLPRLLDAEKQATIDTLTTPVNLEERNGEKMLFPSPPVYPGATSSQWPEKLQLVSSSTTTVQQSPSIAQAVDHDEHHPAESRDAITGKIKDLLTSTERKSCANKTESGDASKHDVLSSQVNERKESVSEMESIDLQHLPHLKALPDKLEQLYSTDGGQSSNQPVGSTTNAGQTGTSSSKILSRKPTFDRKYTLPSDRRASIPVKASPTTPVRGRTRGTHSPSGRPYSVDHRFALSPSRSDSRGSRGSLTFNIKARVSPGRKFGKKDDTELFVTANIESDDSDEAE